MQFLPCITVAILSLGLVTSPAAAAELGLSRLVLYNTQRIHGEGFGTFTTSLRLNTVKKSPSQQVAHAVIDIDPGNGQTQVKIKNGALIFIFRDKDQLFPDPDDIHAESERLPTLKADVKLELKDGDSVAIIIPLAGPIASKPVDITGALTWQRPDKDFIEAFLKSLRGSKDVAMIGCSVIDKAKERPKKVEEEKEGKGKGEEKTEKDEQREVLNIMAPQWVTFSKSEDDPKAFIIPFYDLLRSLSRGGGHSQTPSFESERPDAHYESSSDSDSQLARLLDSSNSPDPFASGPQTPPLIGTQSGQNFSHKDVGAAEGAGQSRQAHEALRSRGAGNDVNRRTTTPNVKRSSRPASAKHGLGPSSSRERHLGSRFVKKEESPERKESQKSQIVLSDREDDAEDSSIETSQESWTEARTLKPQQGRKEVAREKKDPRHSKKRVRRHSEDSQEEQDDEKTIGGRAPRRKRDAKQSSANPWKKIKTSKG